MKRTYLYPALQALLAALLFGASAPLAKILLGTVEPVLLAGLLYLGSGLGSLVMRGFEQARKSSMEIEARLDAADLPWLVGAILAGGVVAPIILLISLRDTPAATASLLLNFEGVATTLIAGLMFREAISRRAWQAIALIALASVLLSAHSNGSWGFSLGAVGIVTACILWGVDNNFTRHISAKDPRAIVTIKGLAAGTFSLTLALILGNRLPAWWIVLAALILGGLCYGLSIILFVKAMRGLGAARTSALFGTAPLAGAALSFLIFQEMPGWLFIVALPLMVIGALLLINEDHVHAHAHERVEHEHNHRHDDEHHAHEQVMPELFLREHSHLHVHEHFGHEHLHMPDIHHRHAHAEVDLD